MIQSILYGGSPMYTTYRSEFLRGITSFDDVPHLKPFPIPRAKLYLYPFYSNHLNFGSLWVEKPDSVLVFDGNKLIDSTEKMWISTAVGKMQYLLLEKPFSDITIAVIDGRKVTKYVKNPELLEDCWTLDKIDVMNRLVYINGLYMSDLPDRRDLVTTGSLVFYDDKTITERYKVGASNCSTVIDFKTKEDYTVIKLNRGHLCVPPKFNELTIMLNSNKGGVLVWCDKTTDVVILSNCYIAVKNTVLKEAFGALRKLVTDFKDVVQDSLVYEVIIRSRKPGSKQYDLLPPLRFNPTLNTVEDYNSFDIGLYKDHAVNEGIDKFLPKLVSMLGFRNLNMISGYGMRQHSTTPMMTVGRNSGSSYITYDQDGKKKEVSVTSTFAVGDQVSHVERWFGDIVYDRNEWNVVKPIPRNTGLVKTGSMIGETDDHFNLVIPQSTSYHINPDDESIKYLDDSQLYEIDVTKSLYLENIDYKRTVDGFITFDLSLGVANDNLLVFVDDRSLIEGFHWVQQGSTVTILDSSTLDVDPIIDVLVRPQCITNPRLGLVIWDEEKAKDMDFSGLILNTTYGRFGSTTIKSGLLVSVERPITANHSITGNKLHFEAEYKPEDIIDLSPFHDVSEDIVGKENNCFTSPYINALIHIIISVPPYMLEAAETLEDFNSILDRVDEDGLLKRYKKIDPIFKLPPGLLDYCNIDARYELLESLDERYSTTFKKITSLLNGN